MLRRAETLLREHREHWNADFEAELWYRRAALLDDWLRNFDHLVNVPQLPVSTPGCISYGYFCENFVRPEQFNARFIEAPSLSGAITDQRRTVTRWLDSALTLQPAHLAARRLRLRRAAIDGQWGDFDQVAQDGIRADSQSVLPWLALIAEAVQRGDYSRAAGAVQRVDSLVPDELRAEFERLETVSGSTDVEQAQAIWRLSDPLYLTDINERRVQHYARIALADIVFTDPDRGILGRDSRPGQLVLRYGWPKHIWEVRRDGSLELDPDQMRAVFDILSCAGIGVECAIGMETRVPKAGAEAHGRWTFFNYDERMPSFVFERNLSERTYQYKLLTLTPELDSALGRAAPSTYESPYLTGEIASLLTRFPRPVRPTIEVAAVFRWNGSGASDSAELGAFVHERIEGRLVNRGVSARWASDSTRFVSTLAVIPGPLRVAVEGRAPARGIAATQRTEIDLPGPDPGLRVSDILLGESLDAPEDATRREAVRLVHRTDSLPWPSETLALYWEIYGLQPDADSVQRYEVAVQLAEVSGGRTPGAELVRLFGNVLGLRKGDVSFSWRRERPALREYVPEYVTIRLPAGEGSYRLTVSLRDLVGGSSVEASRVVTVTR
jgi:hypothetical protein